jgi:hypothetical protein
MNRRYKQVVFFLGLLISLCSSSINAQALRGDTLKNLNGDTLLYPDEEEDMGDEIRYEAQDSIVALGEGKMLILYGNSKITYGSLTIQAEVIEMDYSKNLITAYGKQDSLGKPYGEPVFKDEEQEIKAKKIMYNLKTKRGKIFGALTRQGEFLVYGNEIKKDSNNVVYLKGMKCIPCKEEDSRTVFRATKAKIIPDDKIVTGPLFLEIGGAPTPLGLPFGFFPNAKRAHSGILIPTFGNSANQGYFLRDGGYYWGINEKTDMIIRGDIFSNGSWGLRTFNTYNLLYKSRGSFNVGYSEYIIGDKDIPSSYSKQNSYTINWQHTQDNRSNPSVRFLANVNYMNSQYNRFNAFNSGQFLTNTFQSNVEYTKAFKWSSLSLNARHNQNTINRQMDLTLPSLTFNVNRFFPLRALGATKVQALDKLGISYNLSAQNSISGADSTLLKGNIADSLKYGIKHSLPISTNFNVFKHITVSPVLNINSYMYTRTLQKAYFKDTDSLSSQTVKGYSGAFDYNFNAGMNTKLYFDYFFKKARLSALRHLMIPTISYGYRPDFGDEKYGYWKSVQTDSLGNQTRYSIYEKNIYGGPSQGGQNSLGINISNNIEAKVKQRTDSGYAFVKTVLLQDLSINGNYNFAADSFNMSTINLSARTKVLKYFDVVASSVFDPYAYNNENKRIEVYAFDYNGKLANFQSAYFTINAAFGSNMLEAIKKARQAPDLTNAVERGAKQDKDLIPQSLNWNLAAYYNVDLRRNAEGRTRPTQTFNFRGDIMPTKYWRVGMTSGYDFNSKSLSYTSINIYRDLKCWEMAIEWVPFGFNKRYSVFINLKTPSLSSVKVPRQKGWFDNIQ